jgi:hypothetical protein
VNKSIAVHQLDQGVGQGRSMRMFLLEEGEDDGAFIVNFIVRHFECFAAD